MMRWIVGGSLRYRFLVVAVAVAMMAAGVSGLRDTPVDVFPEFAPPRVEVQTISLGLSAEEVESLVTIPLEDSLNGIEGLAVLRSKSVPQLSSIELIFESDTDLQLARQLVTERISLVTPTLPTWASPPVIMPPLSATSRVMKIGLSSDELSLIDMSIISYWKIRAQLLGVPGVANVAIWGERLQQLHVNVDPELMQEYGVSLNQVMRTTADGLDAGILQFSSGAIIGTGGFIETPNQRLGIQNTLPIITPEHLSELPINGNPEVQLIDVANLVEDHQPLVGDAIINDGPGILLIVEKYPWANTIDVTEGVEAELEKMAPGLPGLEIDSTIFRPATFIEMSIDNLTNALLLSALLVIVVLILFLFEWRTVLISLVAIPLSLMAAAIVLNLRGATINVMILAGFVIAIGVVVDDAIIDIENIWRRLRQSRAEGSDKSTRRIILEASLEVRSAIIYATLIDIVVLTPIFFLEGLSGAFFQPLALSYALALLASMVVALTVTPAMSLILLPNAPLKRRESPLSRYLQLGYQAILEPIIRRPRSAFAGVGVVLLLGVSVIPQLGQSLLPEFKERDFLMHWLARPGTSGPEMVRITEQASVELRTIPGVRNFGAHIGQAYQADEVVGIYFGENWISVDPDVDYDETVDAIQETVDGYPGLTRDVQTYLKERIREVLTGSSDAIVIRIYGPDLHILRDKADEVKESLEGIEGLVDLHVELQTDQAQIDIEVDIVAAQRHGLKPGDIRRAATTMMASEEVGDIFRDGKAYDVHVWSAPEIRNDIDSLRGLPLDTPDGSQVLLEDVADVRIVPAQNQVRRENASRYIDVEANVRGRDLGSVVEDVEDAFESVDFPLEYNVEFLGEFKERQTAQQRIFAFGIPAIIAVFILLQLAFGSWRLATLAMITLPAALVGGVLAAYVSGGVISLGSLVGFLTVLGIAGRNGIMMINHFQHLEKYEGEKFGTALVLRGARERLSPIMMTALTTGLALVPLIIAGQIPGHEVEYPLAIVVLGGLITSTLVNLFIVPALYLIFGKRTDSAEAFV